MISARRLRSAARHVLLGSSGARRHLAPGLTLDAFFDALAERGVSYVVLRWFDDLPHVDPGEDVDLLVADEDLAVVHSLTRRRRSLRRTQKLDVYSATGLPGSDFHGIPYYAPRFARAVLDGAEVLRGRYRVPSPQHHYQSLAYHAVYHKGYASGLADGVDPERPRRASDHDYEAVLAALAARLGAPLHPTLDSLDLLLGEQGLRPPLDTLERLAPRNPWIRDRFLAEEPEVDQVWQGLAVFVLRERARAQLDVAVDELDRQGFEVLDALALDARQQETASHRLRGGNWAQGPWALSGGEPSSFIVAYDVAPSLAAQDDRAVNQRVPYAKGKLRDRLLDGVGPTGRYNPVHSSDNPAQALDYLKALGDPEVEDRLRVLAGRLVAAARFPFPVVRVLPSSGRRAQVAVVDHPVHGASVCKVFRPGAARFLERELRARRDLGDLPAVPGLLESGDTWLLMPLYDDDGSHVVRALPGSPEVQLRPWAVQALVRLAADLHSRGLFLLDLSSHNVLHDPVAGLLVLDLEFLQEYAGDVPDARDSYTLRGVPGPDSGYDVPLVTGLTSGVGNSAFHPAVTGSSVDDLLAPPRPGAALRRSAVQLAWWAAFLGRQRYLATRASVESSAVGRDLRALSRLVVRRLARRRT